MVLMAVVQEIKPLGQHEQQKDSKKRRIGAQNCGSAIPDPTQ
jgi:hypothetical protein